MTTKIIKVLAPAKINLFLHLISKRADGYHNIESLFAFTDFGDLITVENADCLSLEITGPFSKELQGFDIEENLVMKAARGLRSLCGDLNLGAKITLNKNLPINSGIGGGSSDAAATIKALQKLWKINLPEEDIYRLGLSLGADVPACLYGKPVFVSGIGENLRPVNRLSDFYCLLVNPGVQVSTPEAFNFFDGKFSASLSHLDDKNICKIENYSNDLQAPIMGQIKEIKTTLESLENEKGCQIARMSGSGATCFGLFETKSDVKRAYQNIQSQNKTWWGLSGMIRGPTI